MHVSFPVQLKSLKFTYQRFPGFGSDNEFTIIIYGEGKVEFFAKKSNSFSGHHASKIDKRKVLKLFAKAMDIGFFQLKDTYVGEDVYILDNYRILNESVSTTDISYSIVEIYINNKTHKRIHNYQGAPQRLHEFEAMLVKLSGCGGLIG